MENVLNQPAIVRAVDELAELATKINAEHHAGELSVRKGLEHYRTAGDMLLKAKRYCGKGRWLRWLKENVKFSDWTAGRYMKIAREWNKVSNSSSQVEAFRVLDDEQQKSEATSNFHQSTVDKEEMPHVARNTGENEWYTPPEYLDAARDVLGEIELDPASSDKAQETVRARTYYTEDDDGLTKDWRGRVWMNPPYAAGLIDRFTEKLAGHFQAGEVSEAIVLVNNATETEWFQGLAGLATAICFPSKRIRFLDPEGNPGAPLQGQAVVYLGTNTKRFMQRYKTFGFCLKQEALG